MASKNTGILKVLYFPDWNLGGRPNSKIFLMNNNAEFIKLLILKLLKE